MDIATIKQRQQATWASGDLSAVGARVLITAELLCEAVDLHGEPAARIASYARAGQVLVSETAHRSDHHDLRFEPLGPIELKGIAKPLALYQAFRTS